VNQELKEMLPAKGLTIAIRNEFRQPRENQGKSEWIKYFSISVLSVRCRMNT